MKVRELMTADVECCSDSDDCAEAVRIMWESDCGIVPVVDAERRVVGTVTDRDIAIACWSRSTGPAGMPIGDTMTRDVACCRPDDSVGTAENLMEERQVRRLPVVDGNDRLCGILSLADITQEARAHRKNGAARAEIRPEKVVEAYAAVCHPRPERLH